MGLALTCSSAFEDRNQEILWVTGRSAAEPSLTQNQSRPHPGPWQQPLALLGVQAQPLPHSQSVFVLPAPGKAAASGDVGWGQGPWSLACGQAAGSRPVLAQAGWGLDTLGPSEAHSNQDLHPEAGAWLQPAAALPPPRLREAFSEDRGGTWRPRREASLSVSGLGGGNPGVTFLVMTSWSSCSWPPAPIAQQTPCSIGLGPAIGHPWAHATCRA